MQDRHAVAAVKAMPVELAWQYVARLLAAREYDACIAGTRVLVNATSYRHIWSRWAWRQHLAALAPVLRARGVLDE